MKRGLATAAAIPVVFIILYLAVGIPSSVTDIEGTTPAPGLRIPPFADEERISPSFPAYWQENGDTNVPVFLVVTCADCEAGAAFGSLIPRLVEQSSTGFTEGAQLRVIVLDDEPAARSWSDAWEIPAAVHIHHINPEHRRRIAQMMFLDPDLGVGAVFDVEGDWVSTFHAGSSTPAQVLNDLEVARARTE